MANEQTEHASQTFVGQVLSADAPKSGVDKSGNDWVLYSFKIATPAGERTFRTFDQALGSELQQGLGQTFEFEYVEEEFTAKSGPRAGQKTTSRKLVSAKPAPAADFGSQPAQGAAPQPPSTGLTYDQAKAVERDSIHRQGALKAAVELGGTQLEVLVTADSFYAWLSKSPGPAGVSSPNGSRPKLDNISDLLKAANERFGMTSQEVGAALNVAKPVEVKDFVKAWGQLVSKWGQVTS